MSIVSLKIQCITASFTVHGPIKTNFKFAWRIKQKLTDNMPMQIVETFLICRKQSGTYFNLHQTIDCLRVK